MTPTSSTPTAPEFERDPLVRGTLRAEALAAFVAGISLYFSAGGGWILVLPALLAPDISVVGYLAGPRVGAVVYNLVHDWALGIALLLLGWWMPSPLLVMAGGILVAHVGMDRFAGYGLKYPTSFNDTHLGRIGKRRVPGTQ